MSANPTRQPDRRRDRRRPAPRLGRPGAPRRPCHRWLGPEIAALGRPAIRKCSSSSSCCNSTGTFKPAPVRSPSWLNLAGPRSWRRASPRSAPANHAIATAYAAQTLGHLRQGGDDAERQSAARRPSGRGYGRRGSSSPPERCTRRLRAGEGDRARGGPHLRPSLRGGRSPPSAPRPSATSLCRQVGGASTR